VKKARSLRLLPGVIIVCAGLLALNASGLMHRAYAGEDAAAAAPDDAPPVPANKDFAGDDDHMASAAEVDVLTSLSKRSATLDARQAQIQVNANMLAATEARIDAKIAQLKTLQSRIDSLIGQRDAAQEKQVAALVKTYSAMKPKDAARIFNSLDDDVLLPVAGEMKADVLAPVLSAMAPDAARKLTIKLANRLNLPDTTPPAAAGSVATTPEVQTPLAQAAPALTAAAPSDPGPQAKPKS
jgi:flagellar motility protein MotE (MotC chaperone)